MKKGPLTPIRNCGGYGTIDVQGGLRTPRKGSSLLQGTRNEDLSSLELPGHSSLSTLDKFYGILVPKRGLVGEQQLKQWCKLLADHRVQVEWSQENPESACGIRRSQSVCQLVWPGATGVIRFTVVEQDVSPLLRLECEGYFRPPWIWMTTATE